MQLESHATPPQETPEQRYATLHRAIERGLASDEVWKELAEVSLRLGHSDEAIRSTRNVKSDAVRALLESRLRRLGLLAADDPSSVPARPEVVQEEDRTPDNARLVDHLVDAGQYLFHQHMPWLVLITTLAFPLVIGVGGFLTAGESPWMLAAIAALPGLSVLAIVGAMGRQIMIASSEGNVDVPPIPGFWELIEGARRFTTDVLLVFASLIAPSLIAMALGAPSSTTVPGLLIGAFLAPLMFTLRQLRGDLRALSPTTLMRTLMRAGGSYCGLGIATCLMFVPAALIAFAVGDRPFWVQIAVVGPLCVVPIFAASRLFGTWVDSKRSHLAGLLSLRVRKDREPATAKATSQAGSKGGKARFPQRPAALQHFRAPVVKKVTGKATAKKAAPVQHARAPARPVAPAEDPRPTRNAAGRKPPPAKPAKPAPHAIEGRSPRRKVMSEGPDLAAMPGAVVLSGDERQRMGAAAKKQ